MIYLGQDTAGHSPTEDWLNFYTPDGLWQDHGAVQGIGEFYPSEWTQGIANTPEPSTWLLLAVGFVFILSRTLIKRGKHEIVR